MFGRPARHKVWRDPTMDYSNFSRKAERCHIREAKAPFDKTQHKTFIQNENDQNIDEDEVDEDEDCEFDKMSNKIFTENEKSYIF